jgi:DNA-binding Lrp family transcriptional regulator
MISAVVLVNTDSNTRDDVLENVKQVEGVKEVHPLYGIYDLLLKVKVNSIDEFKNTTKAQINQVRGVTGSLTLMINDSNEPVGNRLQRLF